MLMDLVVQWGTLCKVVDVNASIFSTYVDQHMKYLILIFYFLILIYFTNYVLDKESSWVSRYVGYPILSLILGFFCWIVVSILVFSMGILLYISGFVLIGTIFVFLVLKVKKLILHLKGNK